MCGIVGYVGVKQAAPILLSGLSKLEYRGYDSAGLAVRDEANEHIEVVKAKGRLKNLMEMTDSGNAVHGLCGIGHTRWATHGEPSTVNAHPQYTREKRVVIVHNGIIENYQEIKESLLKKGYTFASQTDTEVAAALLDSYYAEAAKRESDPRARALDAIRNTMIRVRGSYALVLLAKDKLIGIRDPYGIRPLCLGRVGNSFVLASESCALDAVGAEFVRDVQPGEIVVIDAEGIHSMHVKTPMRSRLCLFEFVYFARPDSVIDGINVYQSRVEAGKRLAIDDDVEADMVIGVPDSALAAAMGYAQQSGIPYGDGLAKNRYVGRTFIKPKQSSRESSVRVKLNVLREVVKDKRVILIDDSIVRGTTSDQIVNMLKDAGAKEVHMRISSPPFLWPCYFGIDVPERHQLIAYNHTVDEICKEIGADTLGYLRLERLPEMVNGLGICTGCFTGNYPIPAPKDDIRGEYEA